MMVWLAIASAAAGCYLLKFAGLAAPRRLLEHPLARRFAVAVPVALLAALIATQVTAPEGQAQTVALDVARLGGLGIAVVALLLRAPFLVVIVIAAGTTSGLRALGVA